MARVSKKVSAAQREAENALHRVWKTAIYARLSDFDDVLRNTESLEVQISYIKEYINHRDDSMLLDVFADKRCTGMNFDRPEFERLLKALQERKVNCIVVKDFSRLGRNFVETGQYLEQVFPLFGVRFIAINDNYDSLNSQSRDGMLVPIKSMINEMYSKDLSQKIQSSCCCATSAISSPTPRWNCTPAPAKSWYSAPSFPARTAMWWKPRVCAILPSTRKGTTGRLLLAPGRWRATGWRPPATPTRAFLTPPRRMPTGCAFCPQTPTPRAASCPSPPATSPPTRS